MGIEENIVQKNIQDYLDLLGIDNHRNNTGRRGKVSYGRKNSGDIYAILPPNGRFMAVEVKRPGEKPTKGQLEYGAEIEKSGAVYIWADSIGMFIKKFSLLQHAP